MNNSYNKSSNKPKTKTSKKSKTSSKPKTSKTYQRISEARKFIHYKKNQTKTFVKPLRIFFDNFKSLKGKIPRYDGIIPTKYTDIKETMAYISENKFKDELENLHKGQRKLMVMELDFINYIWSDIVKNGLENDMLFVYVGAAPSYHTTLLAELFPKWKFILYDPRDMLPALSNYDNIEIHNKFFTDDDCKRFKKDANRVLFVSDVRDQTFTTYENDTKREHLVFNDMLMQMDWVKLIKPLASSLKFRLPYNNGKTTYLNGELKIQCWAPKQSTEARLFVPQNFKLVKYSNKEHEEKASYFNNVIRKSYHPHDGECYQHNYDSTREYHIVKEFIENALGMKNSSEKDKQTRICKMLTDINKCVRLKKSVIPVIKKDEDIKKYKL